MQNIQIWFMDSWRLLLRMFSERIFLYWVWGVIGSFLLIWIGSYILIRIKVGNPSTDEKPDQIVYSCGMYSFLGQAILFFVYPLLYRSDFLLFHWILFLPFILVIIIDIYWFFVLKNKLNNNPE